MKINWPLLIVGLLIAACSAPISDAQGNGSSSPIMDEDLLKGHRGDPESWPMYGGSYDQQRFSDLDQINRDNVKDLEPAWIAHTDIYNIASGYQTTPIVFGGDMYVTTPRVGREQWVIKYDAETGKEYWRTPVRIGTARYCCGPNNRGVALYEDKVILATLDARMIAMDPEDGSIIWETQIADPEMGYSETSPPAAYDGKLFIGAAGGEYGIRGFLKAFDADTGKELWTWHTIPSPEEGGWEGDWVEEAPGLGISLNRDIEKEKAELANHPDAWEHGGVPIWTTPSLDPELRLVYVTTGNPGPDYDTDARPGDNLWGDSLCAVNMDTGELEWGFQYVPHDVWDYDGGCPPLLFDIEFEGEQRKVVGLFTKLGIFYLLDRKTGELLKASENYVPHENLFVVPNPEGVTIAPGSAGGTNWSPASYNPLTKWVYATNMHWPMVMTQAPQEYKEGVMYQGGNASFANTQNLETWGVVTALNPVTGKVVWETRTEKPMFSGLITTAGGLVFAGQSDNSFDAWDAETGEHLWQYKTDAGANAAPMTYQINGRQFIAVAAGGSRYTRRSRDDAPQADAIIVFALPEK
ncbi:MAG: PQQ-binding-like beta-propeller repeat protein [Candidatus Hydrogenedentota bacterium]